MAGAPGLIQIPLNLLQRGTVEIGESTHAKGAVAAGLLGQTEAQRYLTLVASGFRKTLHQDQH
jgi:hypothetical protein